MAITVRTATVRDIPVVLGLLYELGRPRPQKDSEADSFRDLAKKYIAEPDKHILVAVRDDVKLVGMAATMLLPRLNRSGPELYIPELIVAEDYRGRGAGRMLVESCIRLARGKKCHRIRLESANKREDSHAFYRAAGFAQSALSFSMDL